MGWQLYDLMTMAFKYQVLLCPRPKDVLLVTFNHLDAIKGFIRDSPTILHQVDETFQQLTEVSVSSVYHLSAPILVLIPLLRTGRFYDKENRVRNDKTCLSQKTLKIYRYPFWKHKRHYHLIPSHCCLHNWGSNDTEHSCSHLTFLKGSWWWMFYRILGNGGGKVHAARCATVGLVPQARVQCWPSCPACPAAESSPCSLAPIPGHPPPPPACPHFPSHF